MHGRSYKHSQRQYGVAMVEFAIALPLLLLLLLAIAEFGRMLYHYNNLLQANRDAVRYLAGQAWDSTLGQVQIDGDLVDRTSKIAVYGVPTAEVGQEVVPGLNTGHVQVFCIDSVAGPVIAPCAGADHVQVSIRYEFQPMIGNGLPALIGDAIPLNFPLVATTVMRGL